MKGGIKLKNLGNTSYLNAALQCLSHSPLLTPYVLSHLLYQTSQDARSTVSTPVVLLAYSHVLASIWSDQPTPVDPTELVQVFRASHPGRFPEVEQHDAPEALDSLLADLVCGLFLFS
jgi:ubiquitin carboxyl-terminal hydrolase 4/11/15